PGWASPQGAAPGHGLLGWAAATQQPGQPGQTGTLWGDTVPSPWDRHESPEGWQESGGAGQEEEKPKEAPSPGGTILLTAYEQGAGRVGHSALYIPGKGFLYDPAGTYNQRIRGTGGWFYEGDEDFPSLQDYINYHNKTGWVEQVKIPTTPSEEALIISRAESMRDPAGLECAARVSTVLEGICGIKKCETPNALKAQAINAKRDD
ncbi:hypothetical protein, partial [Fundidesulfovibrio magnetotacticus]|uniref:hypothetical protein n=1 Tax=Fundidesulfovibrio magnetotacticus TaxID=2730080 RepID=UPI001C2541CD